jgi:hypothetical protein
LHLQERLTQDLVNKVDNVDSKMDKVSTAFVDGFQGMDKRSELSQASSDRRLAGTFMQIAQQLTCCFQCVGSIQRGHHHGRYNHGGCA